MPLIVDKYILLIAKKTQKIQQNKTNKQKNTCIQLHTNGG